jgi:hypothetical protein
MGSVVIEPPQAVIEADKANLALSWPEKAKAIAVKDQAGYDQAIEVGRGIVALRKEIEAQFAKPKKKAHEAHKAITAMEKKYLDPLVQAESILKASIVAFTTEQERLRREEEARIRAEQERLAEEARLAAAIEAEQAGATEAEVQAVIEEPAFIAPVVAAPTYQKATGVSTPVTWSAEVISMKQLCAEISAGRQPETLVLANQPVLNKMAVALKSALAIPGVKAVSKTGARF